MPVDGGRLGILGVVRIFVLDVAGVAVVATGTGIHGGNRHKASQSTFSSDLRIDGTAAAADANTSTGIMCRAETGTVEAPAKLVKGHLTLSFCLLGARIGTHTSTVHRGVPVRATVAHILHVPVLASSYLPSPAAYLLFQHARSFLKQARR